MGMANSAQSFQRLVESVIGDLGGVFVYLDDLLLYTKTEEEHLTLLNEVLSRLDKAGLTLALSKCIFGAKSVDYLGYTVTEDGLTPIKKKIQALEKFPPPTKQKEALAFLGAMNYYRASLPNLKANESADPEQKETRAPAAILDPLYKVATCKMEKKKGIFEHTFMNN